MAIIKSNNHACPAKGGVQTIKAHGGEIKAEAKVDVADLGLSVEGNPGNFGKGEGSEFIIQIVA